MQAGTEFAMESCSRLGFAKGGAVSLRNPIDQGQGLAGRGHAFAGGTLGGRSLRHLGAGPVLLWAHMVVKGENGPTIWFMPITLRLRCVFVPVPWARGQRGFPFGAGSVCSGTQDGICSQQQSLETIKSVRTIAIKKPQHNTQQRQSSCPDDSPLKANARIETEYPVDSEVENVN